MASFHFSAQIIKRSDDRSAVAAAAYRAGERLHDLRKDRVANYSRKKGIGHTEIMLPEGTPAWMRDREKLWQAVEAGERRRDAQLARELNLALPHECTDEERLALVRGFVREQFVARGMVADFAIHHPVPEHGDDARNFHVHIMLSLRQAGPEGFRKTKTREWNSDKMLTSWREAWATWQNRLLERGRHKDRVDHRSLVAQRADAVARGDRRAAASLDRQAEIHVGPRARKLARDGKAPRNQDRNAGPRFKRHADGRRFTREERKARPTVEARTRTIHYSRYGTTTRLQTNAARLEFNLRHYMNWRARKERQAARVRDRVIRLERALRVGGTGPGGRRAQRLHRNHQLLADVEQLIARLLHMERVHRRRRQSVLERVLSADRGLGQGRGRERGFFA